MLEAQTHGDKEPSSGQGQKKDEYVYWVHI